MINETKNPYIAGAPVVESSMFFGRDDVFDWIEQSLIGKYVDHVLVIHGQRRVGKTSVLKQLPNRIPERYITIFFDLQGRSNITVDRFFWGLAREIVNALRQDRGLDVNNPNKTDFENDPEFFETHFLPNIINLIGDHILLICFDEFDALEGAEITDKTGKSLIDYLKRLIGSEKITFIFSVGSSGRKLEYMQATYTRVCMQTETKQR